MYDAVSDPYTYEGSTVLKQATCSSGLLMVQRVILWRRANSVAIGDEADSSWI